MTAKRVILVVDDDEDVRESVAGVLADESYDVHTATDGRDALRVLRETNVRPDVILLDMMMPHMDGWEFRQVQLGDPALASIPVVVFTAYGVPNEIVAQLEAAGYVKKPSLLGDIVATLERVLRDRREH
jgi:CheY-like chemotaxis protein